MRAAVEAGAENVTLCDTNGATLPTAVAEATADVVAQLGEHVQIGIHAHDDAGCRRGQQPDRGAERALAWSRAR
ncbi:MAG: hypothetical protein WKF40_09565 [Thermoleophilaceae bacterium]